MKKKKRYLLLQLEKPIEFKKFEEYKKFESFIPQLELAIEDAKFSEQKGGDFLLQGLHTINRWRLEKKDASGLCKKFLG